MINALGTQAWLGTVIYNRSERSLSFDEITVAEYQRHFGFDATMIALLRRMICRINTAIVKPMPGF